MAAHISQPPTTPATQAASAGSLAPKAFMTRPHGTCRTPASTPKGTNGSQLTAYLTYVGSIPSSAGIPQPTFNVPGPVLINSGVTISSPNLYGLNLNLVVGSGMGPSGGVCSAAVTLSAGGTHGFANINVDVQNVPGVDVMHDEVNGTNHINIQGDHWTGICGSQTVSGASGTAGSLFVAVSSTTGLTDLMVSRGNATIGIPDRAAIVDVPDSATCQAQVSAAACVVVSKPLTASFSASSITFDTDASGEVCGFANTNCGGTWPTFNLFEWLNNNYQVGVAAAQYGYAFECIGKCNDIALGHGLLQNGVAPFAMGDGAGGAHLTSIEFNHGNYSSLAGASATFAGNQMTVTGTVGTWAIGETLKFNGMTSPAPTITALGTGTGGDGTYTLSASQNGAGPKNVTAVNTVPAQETNSPAILLAAGAVSIDFGNRMQFNGGGIQSFVTRATSDGSSPPAESQQTPINGESSKITSTQYINQTPNAFVQAYTDQPLTNMSGINIDPFNSVFPGSTKLVTQYGPGSLAASGSPNQFDLSNSTIEDFLIGQESYTGSATLSASDCGYSIAANANSAAATFTMPDSISSPAQVGAYSSCYMWIYTQGNYPTTLAATSAATFNGAAGPVTLAQNTGYLVKTTGIPGSALNWSISPPPPVANTPATMATSTGNTIGQINIVKGTVTRSGCSAALTDTTATATQIEANMPANTVFTGGGVPFRDINTCSYAVTIAGGVGVTVNTGDKHDDPGRRL